jgi:hypothetical protein
MSKTSSYCSHSKKLYARAVPALQEAAELRIGPQKGCDHATIRGIPPAVGYVTQPLAGWIKADYGASIARERRAACISHLQNHVNGGRPRDHRRHETRFRSLRRSELDSAGVSSCLRVNQPRGLKCVRVRIM